MLNIIMSVAGDEENVNREGGSFVTTIFLVGNFCHLRKG